MGGIWYASHSPNLLPIRNPIMIITVPAHESPKRALCNAAAQRIPDHRIAVYYNEIEIGKHTVKCSPGLEEQLRGISNSPFKVKLSKQDMTAYLVGGTQSYEILEYIDSCLRKKSAVEANNVIEAAKQFLNCIESEEDWERFIENNYTQFVGENGIINIDGHCEIKIQPHP